MATLNTKSDSSSALSDSTPPTAKDISVPDSQGERGETDPRQPTHNPTGESAPEAKPADSPTLAGLTPNSKKRAIKAKREKERRRWQKSEAGKAGTAAGSVRQPASAKGGLGQLGR